mmetsp:Transcript_13188/g.40559  ORF Transcript_13188/g.40559 Transcript_13188/m.40559 type:complete len:165 (-) Transcript_13188:470-964(-)
MQHLSLSQDLEQFEEVSRTAKRRLEQLILLFVDGLRRMSFRGAGGQVQAARWLFVAKTVYGLLQTGKTISKRDLYYLDVALFGRQQTSDCVLEKLAGQLKLCRNATNVIAAPRSLISGNISWVGECGEVHDAGRHGMSTVFVPSFPRLPAELYGPNSEQKAVFS